MKTHTSKTSKWIRSFLLLPLLAFMVYGFSSKEEKFKEHEPIAEINAIEDNDYAARSLTINILKDGTYVIDDEVTANKTNLVEVVNQFHQDITSDVRSRIMNIHVTSASEISEKETWFLYESLIDYGFHRMVTPNEEIVKSKGNTPVKSSKVKLKVKTNPLELKLNNKKTSLESLKKDLIEITNGEPIDLKIESSGKFIEYDLLEKITILIEGHVNSIALSDGMRVPDAYKIQANEDYSFQVVSNGATVKELETYKQLATKYNKQPEATRLIPLDDLRKLEIIYRKMSDEQKVKAEPFPNCAPENVVQKGASREQMKTYNKLAAHYNEMIKKGGNVKIQMKDVEMLKYIYSLMSKKQRADAEPFPDFPDPPPPPTIPEDAAPEEKRRYKLAAEKYYKEQKMKARALKSSDSDVPPPPPPPVPEDATPEEKRRYKLAAEKYYQEQKMKAQSLKSNNSDVPPPPPPPETPKSPLDHIVEMAKKNATFYLNDKKISSDEAVKALKKNKSLNVQTIDANTDHPVVYIQTRPIKIKNKKGYPQPTASTIIEHIKHMNSLNAKFYLNNKKITYKEALQYVKRNKNSEISTSQESNVVIIKS